MSLTLDLDFTAQAQRIADIKAAINKEKSKLNDNATPISFPPRAHSSSSADASSYSSSSTSSTLLSSSNVARDRARPSSFSRTPVMWTEVQERMRMLHAWDAKCTVEEAAVRQLEQEAQNGMEAALGRKSALMEQLQHLCHEEAVLSSTESRLKDEVNALLSQTQQLDNAGSHADEQWHTSTQQNRLRRQQLKDAQRSFEQRKLAQEKERQSLREDAAALDARAVDAEAKIAATVQRISDQERRLRLLEASILESEQSRIEALQRDISRLSAQLEHETL